MRRIIGLATSLLLLLGSVPIGNMSNVYAEELNKTPTASSSSSSSESTSKEEGNIKSGGEAGETELPSAKQELINKSIEKLGLDPTKTPGYMHYGYYDTWTGEWVGYNSYYDTGFKIESNKSASYDRGNYGSMQGMDIKLDSTYFPNFKEMKVIPLNPVWLEKQGFTEEETAMLLRFMYENSNISGDVVKTSGTKFLKEYYTAMAPANIEAGETKKVGNEWVTNIKLQLQQEPDKRFSTFNYNTGYGGDIKALVFSTIVSDIKAGASGGIEQIAKPPAERDKCIQDADKAEQLLFGEKLDLTTPRGQEIYDYCSYTYKFTGNLSGADLKSQYGKYIDLPDEQWNKIAASGGVIDPKVVGWRYYVPFLAYSPTDGINIKAKTIMGDYISTEKKVTCTAEGESTKEYENTTVKWTLLVDGKTYTKEFDIPKIDEKGIENSVEFEGIEPFNNGRCSVHYNPKNDKPKEEDITDNYKEVPILPERLDIKIERVTVNPVQGKEGPVQIHVVYNIMNKTSDTTLETREYKIGLEYGTQKLDSVVNFKGKERASVDWTVYSPGVSRNSHVRR